MLKIVLWKLCFHAHAVRRRCLGRSSRTLNYFAYGANMHPEVLRHRNIRVIRHRHFELEGYTLKFSLPDPLIDGMGWANLEPARGERIAGRLFTISVDDARRLDFFECVPFIKCYRRTYVDQGGDFLDFYQAVCSEVGCKPTEDHLKKIVTSYARSRDASEIVASLAAVETLDQRVERTCLRFGEARAARRSGVLDDWSKVLFRRYVRSTVKELGGE